MLTNERRRRFPDRCGHLSGQLAWSLLNDDASFSARAAVIVEAVDSAFVELKFVVLVVCLGNTGSCLPQ